MNKEMFLEKVRTLPSFTISQIYPMFSSREYASVFIKRLVKAESIQKLAYGIYTAQSDPFIFCTHIFYPSYISSWNALQYYGLTTQLPGTITVISWKKTKVQGVEFVRSRLLFGFTKVRYSNFDVFMATKEKAVIDSVVYNLIPISDLMDIMPDLNAGMLQAYGIRCGKKIARIIGYLMELKGLKTQRIRKFISGDRNYVTVDFRVDQNTWGLRND
jgi:Predicted transcriptional regulator